MKTAKTIVFLFVIIQLSCQTKQANEDSILKIIMPKMQADKLRGSYLYLYDESGKNVQDSVMIQDTILVFSIKNDSSFVPHLVFLKHDDTKNNLTFRRLIGFKNPYVAKTINSSFYIDKGHTAIGTYYNDSSFILSYAASRQNEPYLRNVNLSYPGDDAINRVAVIKRNVSIIKQYSYSLYLLKQLFYYKEHFVDNDLRELLSHFDKEVKQTKMFQSFENYFAISAGFDKTYPGKLKLQDTLGKYTQIGDSSASYNLFIMWASWCGPCRKEIPQLKKVFELYRNKGLVISSISIDDNRESWKAAVHQEKMPWSQYIAIDSTRNILDTHYNINFIPKAYLFDKQKKLIEKFDGSESELEKKLQALFKK